MFFLFFFFNDTATTEIYTLSLHDALPISVVLFKLKWVWAISKPLLFGFTKVGTLVSMFVADRKSTRLNSSHQIISYAVFCLKKKKNTTPSLHATETYKHWDRPVTSECSLH